MARTHRIPCRSFNRSPLAQPFVYPCHCTCGLLQKIPQRKLQGFIVGTGRIRSHCNGRTVRHCARSCKSRWLVRTSFCEPVWIAVQHRTLHLHPAALRHIGGRHLLHRERQEPEPHCGHIHIGDSIVGHSILWQQRCGKHLHWCYSIGCHLYRMHKKQGFIQGRRDNKDISDQPQRVQHIVPEPVANHDRLLIIRTHRYPFIGQHSNGPELARGYLHSWIIP